MGISLARSTWREERPRGLASRSSIILKKVSGGGRTAGALILTLGGSIAGASGEPARTNGTLATSIKMIRRVFIGLRWNGGRLRRFGRGVQRREGGARRNRRGGGSHNFRHFHALPRGQE